MKFKKILLLVFVIIIINVGYSLFYSDLNLLIQNIGLLLGPCFVGFLIADHKWFN